MGRQQTCWAEKRFQGHNCGETGAPTRGKRVASHEIQMQIHQMGLGPTVGRPPQCESAHPALHCAKWMNFIHIFCLLAKPTTTCTHHPWMPQHPQHTTSPSGAEGSFLARLTDARSSPSAAFFLFGTSFTVLGSASPAPSRGCATHPRETPSTLRFNHFCPLLTFFFAPVLVTFFPSRVSSSCFSATPSKKVKRGAKWAKWGGVARPSGGQKNPKPKAKFAHEEEGAKRSA